MSANGLLQTFSETFSNNGQAKQGFNSPRLQVVNYQQVTGIVTRLPNNKSSDFRGLRWGRLGGLFDLLFNQESVRQPDYVISLLI